MPEEEWGRQITKTALKHFGKTAENLGISSQLALDMKQAGMPYTGEEYASVLLMFSLLVPFGLAFLVALFLLLLGTSPAYSLILFFVGFILMGGLIFGIGYIYPSIKTSDITKNITNNLPFATIYMATLANSGMNPVQMFEVMSHFEEFGYISKEASRITRDVRVMGSDISTALERAAERTPSSSFRELLWGIKSTITTGGDVRAFLVEKAQTSMANYRRFLDKFVDQLSILIEIYITAVVVGSIFFIIMGIILGLMGGGETLFMVRMVIYLGVPVISMMFMIFIAGLSPE